MLHLLEELGVARPDRRHGLLLLRSVRHLVRLFEPLLDHFLVHFDFAQQGGLRVDGVQEAMEPQLTDAGLQLLGRLHAGDVRGQDLGEVGLSG